MNIAVSYLQHLYLSLSELQIKREEEITRNPLSKVINVFILLFMNYLINFIFVQLHLFCFNPLKAMNVVEIGVCGNVNH